MLITRQTLFAVLLALGGLFGVVLAGSYRPFLAGVVFGWVMHYLIVEWERWRDE